VHLQIKPGLRTAWRAPDVVQIGLDPGRGTVLEGLTAADRALVERLAEGLDDATLPGAGPAADRARRLLGLLRSGDVLLARRAGRGVLARVGPAARRLAPDAAVWGVVHPGDGDGWELIAARRRREVHVAGRGRLAAALAETLTAAGVGTVQDLPDPPLPGTIVPPGPDLVVLVRAAAADAVAAEHLLAADVPHLSVVVREAGLVVGPLVLPDGGPCLRCLDLHRADRDPAWPRVLAQLPGRPTPADAGEAASSRLGAALAALQVLGHLDGLATPASVGATLEVDLPDGLVSRRPWPVHPACGCSWPGPGARPGDGNGAGERDVPDAPEPSPRASGGGPATGQRE
jgi:hypothetical protein